LFPSLTKENQTEVIRIETRILSPTAINTYMSCPRKFYLRYIKRLRTRPSIHLVRGLVVHKTLHQFHANFPRGPPNRSLKEIQQDLLAIFNREWERAGNRLDYLDMPKQEIDFFRRDSELMLLNFSHWFVKNNLSVPDACESRIWSHNLKAMGIIDAVFSKDDTVILIDYKTSKYANLTDDIQRQAALYALLYQDKYQKIPDAVWIHFLKFPGDPLPIQIDEATLEYGKILIESVREKTVSQNESDYPCKCGGYCERDFAGT